jgi:thiamine biosynthesis lipoprotein
LIRRRRIGIVLTILVVGCATPPSPPRILVSDGRYVMGTVLEVSLYASDPEAGRAVMEELFDVAERLEDLLSVYRPDSDLSRLNASSGGAAQTVDPAVVAILLDSVGFSLLTGGAFDVTVGPLVDLWTAAAATGVTPTQQALDRALGSVGSDKIDLRSDDEVALRVRGMSLNLGGVAKGWALDRMRERLLDRGIDSALLNFGQSSTWAIGTPPAAPGWRLLARSAAGGFLGVMSLEDTALSVSGTLGDFVEIGGHEYGHILDPRTGQPLSERRQAIVLAPDAAIAEALSKALLLMGERDGIALIEAQPGCEALLDDADGGRWATSGWQKAAQLIALEAAPSPAEP